MSYPKKLKRGLEDISPLFQEARKNQPQLLESGPEVPLSPVSVPAFGSILGVCRGDGTNFGSAALLAGELFAHERDALLITLNDGVHAASSLLSREGLYRCPLSWTAFKKLCQAETSRPVPEKKLNRSVVLDFDLRTGFPEETLLPLLDKCIFWVQPAFESLSAVYKLIKSAASMNQALESYLVYEGKAGDIQGEFIFERLSQMCSQHLGINLTWLGSAWMDTENSRVVSALHLEHLWLRPVEKSMSPEKIQLLQFAAAPPAGENV